ASSPPRVTASSTLIGRLKVRLRVLLSSPRPEPTGRYQGRGPGTVTQPATFCHSQLMTASVPILSENLFLNRVMLASKPAKLSKYRPSSVLLLVSGCSAGLPSDGLRPCAVKPFRP